MSDELIEQIERDRDDGTPGPWRLGSWGDNVFGTGPKDEWLEVCRVKRDNAPLEESVDAIDARRIARVPEMEARILSDADEITRLRADLAAAREHVAGAYLAAADTAYLWHDDDDAQGLRETILTLTDADATAALEARDARVRAEALEQGGIEKRIFDLNAEALSEIKATVDGKSDQTVRSIIYGLIDALHTVESRKAGGE